MKIAVAAAIAVLAIAAGVARPPAAAAATPCWKTLLNDWYDGRIDNTYPIHCYQDALKHLPADVQTYSSAHDDILRALQSAKAALKRSGKTVTPNTPVPPAGGSGGKKTGGSGGKRSTTSTNTSSTPSPTTTSPGRTPPGGLPGVADKANNSGATSVPLPLIVLGALALLLVAAGAGGLLLKRRQRP